MQRIFLAVLVCISLVTPVFGERRLSLQDAVDTFISNNLLLKSKKAGLKKFDAEVRAIGQRPNPSFNAEIESLKNGERETESTYGLSFPITDKGFRRWSQSAARFNRDSSYFQVDYETSLEISSLKKAFFKSLYLQENLSSLQAVIQFFSELERKNDGRLQAGDIAEVELLKLASEKQKVARSVDAMRLEYDLEVKNLMLQLAVSSEAIALSEPFFKDFIPMENHDLFAVAMENRLDLKSSLAIQSGFDASLKAARRETKGPINVDLGFKNRTGGFKGFVIGISVPLSWSNKNQAKIQAIQAEKESERLKLTATQQALENTIGGLREKLRFFQSRVEDLQTRLSELREISRITTASYEEGESSLLELLDSFRAERDLVMERNQANLDYWSAAFDLEAVIGTELQSEGK